MTENKKISTITLILRGWITVFIPVTIIILAIWFGLWTIFDLNYFISVLFGTMIGWYYWVYSVKKWIRWAAENNID